MKWVAAGLCAFEVGAITTGRYPTLTQISGRHRWVGPLLVASLAVHLWRQPGIARAARPGGSQLNTEGG